MDSSPATEHAPRTDGELLRRYVDSRDEAALTELITRHVDLVRGVCRRVLGNSPDADDAFQATFLVLIRCGERIRRPQSLAAWLFGVAHRIAKRQRRQQIRPAGPIREEQAMIESDQLSELADRHDISLFDAELARLPEKYRAPIVLHHLEGKSQREVAAAMQLTEGAVDGLLKRGRNELRVRLARRGVVFGITLAAIQSSQAAMAGSSPQALIEATVEGLLSYDPILHPEPVQTPAARLAHQEISTMGLFQATKIGAWTVVASLLLGATGIGVSTARQDRLTNSAISSRLLALGPTVVAEVSAAESESTEQPSSSEKETVNSGGGEMVSRNYADVGRLLGPGLDNPADREKWIQQVQEIVGGEWKNNENSKTGGMIVFDAKNNLLIRQNAETHDRIAALLSALRRARDNSAPVADATETQKQSVADVLKELTQVEADDTPLRDVLKQLSARHNLPIRIDGITIGKHGLSKMPDQRVNFIAQDATLKDVLHVFLEPMELDYVIENDGIRITSADEARRIHGGKHESRIVNRSHAGESIAIVGNINLDGDGKSDRDTFLHLLRAAGIKLADLVDETGKRWGEKLTEETKFLVVGDFPDPRLKRNRAEREQAEKVFGQFVELRKEAKANGVRLVSLNDFLEYIGEPKANPVPEPARPRPIDMRQRKPTEVRIETALKESTEASFVDTSLRDALDYFKDLHNIAFVINGPEIVADGGSLDQQVSLELSNVTLESALNRMLEPIDLDYIIKDEVLTITTRNKAGEWLELRVYPRSLLTSAWGDATLSNEAAEEKLLKTIEDAVGGDWQKTMLAPAGGEGPNAKATVQTNGGTMSLTPAGLVVRQNQRTHREIENLLEQLRRAKSDE